MGVTSMALFCTDDNKQSPNVSMHLYILFQFFLYTIEVPFENLRIFGNSKQFGQLLTFSNKFCDEVAKSRQESEFMTLKTG